MAIRVKSKKPPRGAGRLKKKNEAGHGKKASVHAGSDEPKHATTATSLIAKKSTHKAHRKRPPVTKSSHTGSAKSTSPHKPKRSRKFVVAAEGSARPFAVKKNKKNQVALRFTENTLRDIAALECVRRCFH